MKRRAFLTATSTVGIIGVASTATIASSVFTSLNTSALIQEFPLITKSVMDKFVSDVKLNTQELGIADNFTKNLITPVQIVSKNTEKGKENVIFKNKMGSYVSLSVKNGVDRIEVLSSL